MKNKSANKVTKPELYKAVNVIGGVVLLSKKLGVTYTSISKWLHSDIKIPIKHAIAIEKLTKGKVSAKDLRPDIYKYDIKN